MNHKQLTSFGLSRRGTFKLLIAGFLVVAARVGAQVQVGGRHCDTESSAVCNDWAGGRCDASCAPFDGCAWYTTSFHNGDCSYTGACYGS